MRKTGRINKKYSAEFKLSVILDMRNNHLSYIETMRKYFPHLYRKNFAFLKKWERMHIEERSDGFMVKRRGRNSKGRPCKKLSPEVEEDLIAENQRLKEQLQYAEAEL